MEKTMNLLREYGIVSYDATDFDISDAIFDMNVDLLKIKEYLLTELKDSIVDIIYDFGWQFEDFSLVLSTMTEIVNAGPEEFVGDNRFKLVYKMSTVEGVYYAYAYTRNINMKAFSIYMDPDNDEDIEYEEYYDCGLVYKSEDGSLFLIENGEEVPITVENGEMRYLKPSKFKETLKRLKAGEEVEIEPSCLTCYWNFDEICANSENCLENNETTFGMSIEEAQEIFPNGCNNYIIDNEICAAIQEYEKDKHFCHLINVVNNGLVEKIDEIIKTAGKKVYEKFYTENGFIHYKIIGSTRDPQGSYALIEDGKVDENIFMNEFCENELTGECFMSAFETFVDPIELELSEAEWDVKYGLVDKYWNEHCGSDCPVEYKERFFVLPEVANIFDRGIESRAFEEFLEMSVKEFFEFCNAEAEDENDIDGVFVYDGKEWKSVEKKLN